MLYRLLLLLNIYIYTYIYTYIGGFGFVASRLLAVMRHAPHADKRHTTRTVRRQEEV
jgi:hypothetical protein